MEDVDALFGQAFASAPGEQGELDWDIDVGDVPLYLSYGSKLDIGAAPGVSTLTEVLPKKAVAGSRRANKSSTQKATASGSRRAEEEGEAQLSTTFALDRVRDDGVLSRLLGKYGGGASSCSATNKSAPSTSSSMNMNMNMKARGQIAPVEGTGAAVKQRRALMKEVRGATRNGLPKQELTPELERELKFLQMRAYADPARFYKGNDTKELPTHFHLGVEVGGSGSMAPVKADGTASRNENKKRKGVSLMQEMLKDQRVQEWTRKRFDEVGAWGQEGSLVKKSGGKKNKGKNGWKNKKKR